MTKLTAEFPSLRALLCACIMAFAFSANYTNHAPLVPALTETFGFSLALAGLLTTGIFFTHAVLQIPGGHLADSLGPRPIVTVALAVVCVGNFAIAFSTAYWHLLFWKVFVGLGTGSCFVAGARYIAGSFSGRRLNLEQNEIVEAAVVGMPDDLKGEVPIAYIVPRDACDVGVLEERCRAALATFKVPRAFILVDKLPRTALGKIQKHLLPKP